MNIYENMRNKRKMVEKNKEGVYSINRMIYKLSNLHIHLF